MSILQQIKYLIQKEFLLEWRQKYAINGILLYVVSTVVVVYLSFAEVEEMVWVTLFWIILLFTSVNAVAKSFLQERVERQRYYYTLASAEAVILAKMIYNVLLLLLLTAVALAVYILVMGNPVVNLGLFLLAVFLGAIGFALCFTLISAIAAKASNNATLMPILSFPIVIFMLGLLITISKTAILGVEDTNLNKDLTVLLALDGILITLSVVLFPYLWRD